MLYFWPIFKISASLYVGFLDFMLFKRLSKFSRLSSIWFSSFSSTPGLITYFLPWLVVLSESSALGWFTSFLTKSSVFLMLVSIWNFYTTWWCLCRFCLWILSNSLCNLSSSLLMALKSSFINSSILMSSSLVHLVVVPVGEWFRAFWLLSLLLGLLT